MNKLSNKNLFAVVALLGVVFAGTVAEKLWPTLFTPPSVELPPTGCDLQVGSCTVSLPEGDKLTFAISPRPIPVLQPIRLEATLTGGDAKSVEVDFTGVDMKMGFNRPVLQASGAGRFVGDATLPICTRNSMAWRATVLVNAHGKLYAAPFEFTTSRN
ncbi:MAG: hypothetical protein KGZ83_19475 [Sulfuricella sp.]|nr:hypothetical protein [Sulfuricella sp.]